MKASPDTPEIGNGLVQLGSIEESTRQIWVICAEIQFKDQK